MTSKIDREASWVSSQARMWQSEEAREEEQIPQESRMVHRTIQGQVRFNEVEKHCAN